MHLTSTIVAALLSGTTLAQQTSNTCTNITPSGNEAYKNYDPVRISEGLVCNADLTTSRNGTCPLQSWAYISYGTRFNVSFTDDDQRQDMIDAVGGGQQDPIVLARRNISGIVANETFHVPRGQSAYVQFAEEYSCRTSYLRGCKGTLSEFDKTYVEVCYPTYNTGSGIISMFYSESSLVRVDTETAKGMTDHPYGMNSTESGSMVGGSNGTSNDSGTMGVEQQIGNGAGSLGLSAVAVAALGTIMMFGPL